MPSRSKLLFSGILIVVAAIFAYLGFQLDSIQLLNLGAGATLLSLVVMILKEDSLISDVAAASLARPTLKAIREIISDLDLRGTAVFIPPYANLRKGGIFVPASERFRLNLRKYEESMVFVSGAGKGESGLLLRPIGEELVKMFRDHGGEGRTGRLDRVESVSSSVLSRLGFIKRLSIAGKEDKYIIRLTISQEVFCNFSPDCEKLPCPICSSILEFISSEIGEILVIESIDKRENQLKIDVKSMGGVKN